MSRSHNNRELDRLRRVLDDVPSKALDKAEQAIKTGVDEGATLMRLYIATRGTDYSHSRGRLGRIESGLMFNAVDSQTQRSSDAVIGRFGWLNEKRDYFAWQEQGFQHWQSGKDVEPMFALMDAIVKAREVVERELNQK